MTRQVIVGSKWQFGGICLHGRRTRAQLLEGTMSFSTKPPPRGLHRGPFLTRSSWCCQSFQVLQYASRNCGLRQRGLYGFRSSLDPHDTKRSSVRVPSCSHKNGLDKKKGASQAKETFLRAQSSYDTFFVYLKETNHLWRQGRRLSLPVHPPQANKMAAASAKPGMANKKEPNGEYSQRIPLKTKNGVNCRSAYYIATSAVPVVATP